MNDPVQNSTAISAPAFAVAENVFKTMLQEPDPKGHGLITILTGGGGSGKTTAAESMPSSKALTTNSQIVFETLLRSEERGDELIRAVLLAGKKAGIIYVHRAIEHAAIGALVRSKNNRRIYPIDKLASGHYEAQRTILILSKKHEGNVKVGFLALDNNGNLNQVKLSTVSLLEQPSVKYINLSEVERRARKAIEDEYNRRKGTAEAIPDNIYHATSTSSS